MSQYIELKIEQVMRSDEDCLSGLLFDLGAQGVSENLEFVQEADNFQPAIMETEVFSLVAFFEERDLSVVIQEVHSRFPYVKITSELLQDKDWLAEWKKGFEPFELCNGFWVCPSWREAPKQAKEVIWMEPGMAFGTGTHATTQLCSEQIVELLPSVLNKVDTAIDVGCGTGILAILLAKLGYENICAFDIDPEAERVLRENCEKNDVPFFNWNPQWWEFAVDAPKIVVANIIDGILLQLKDRFLQNTKEGDFLLLSGILDEREDEFVSKFVDSSFKLIKRKTKDEWVSLLLLRENS